MAVYALNEIKFMDCKSDLNELLYNNMQEHGELNILKGGLIKQHPMHTVSLILVHARHMEGFLHTAPHQEGRTLPGSGCSEPITCPSHAVRLYVFE